jgi:hypothetical protein
MVGGRVDGTVQLWEVGTGLERAVFGSLGGQPIVALSSDGRLLAVADSDKGVRVWDLASRKEFIVTGHEGFVTQLGFTRDGKYLVTSGKDGIALVWDAAKWVTESDRAAKVADERLATLWDDLAGTDGPKAFQAGWELADSDRGVSFLGEQLSPAKPKADPEAIAKWIADLESDTFTIREKAARELEKLGFEAEPALKKLLADPPSLNTKRTASRLLEQLKSGEATPEARRMQRAVEALERAATAEARKTLQKLSSGLSESTLTREARAALSRLGERDR